MYARIDMAVLDLQRPRFAWMQTPAFVNDGSHDLVGPWGKINREIGIDIKIYSLSIRASDTKS
jgi:hypothetical protein